MDNNNHRVKRFAHKAKHHNRAKRYARLQHSNFDSWDEETKARIINQYTETMVPCSCWMCGNPRKWFKQKTRKEILAELDAIQQWEEL